VVQDFALDSQFLEQPCWPGSGTQRRHSGDGGHHPGSVEEFFQRHGPVVRQILHREFRACLDDVHLQVHIVIALRRISSPNLPSSRGWHCPTIFHHIIRLTRFSPAQAYDAVVQPAQQLGLPIDAALVEEMLVPQIHRAGEHAIDLPMLQIVCDAGIRRKRRTAGGAGISRPLTPSICELGTSIPCCSANLDDTLREFQERGRRVRS